MTATQQTTGERYTDPMHAPYSTEGQQGASLLLHGFPGTPAEMRYARQPLSDLGLGTTGIQLPGLGRDIRNITAIEKDDWYKAARAAWEPIQQSQNRSVLIGYSMGGALSIRLAAEYQPACLILLSPFWRFSQLWVQHLIPILQYVRPTVSPFDMASIDDPDFRKSLLDMDPDLDLDDPEVIAQLKKSMVMPTRVINYIRITGLAAYRAATQITCPILILQASADDVVLPQMTDRLVQKFTHADSIEYVQIPGTHEFPKSAGAFQDRIKQFVQNHML